MPAGRSVYTESWRPRVQQRSGNFQCKFTDQTVGRSLRGQNFCPLRRSLRGHNFCPLRRFWRHRISVPCGKVWGNIISVPAEILSAQNFCPLGKVWGDRISVPCGDFEGTEFLSLGKSLRGQNFCPLRIFLKGQNFCPLGKVWGDRISVPCGDFEGTDFLSLAEKFKGTEFLPQDFGCLDYLRKRWWFLTIFQFSQWEMPSCNGIEKVFRTEWYQCQFQHLGRPRKVDFSGKCLFWKTQNSLEDVRGEPADKRGKGRAPAERKRAGKRARGSR